MDFNVEHGIFSWTIENFLLCLTDKNYITESSTFTFANSVWFLRLRVEHGEGKMFFSVELCRHVEDVKPRKVAVKYSLSLKSSEAVLVVDKSECSFLKGGAKQIMHFDCTWQDFLPMYGNDDFLEIECNINTIKHYWKNSDLRQLSEDLMTLFDMKGLHNACLITEGIQIPVHKEILCAYSSVFEEEFQNGDSELYVYYNRDVVEAMLKFLYTGNIEQISINSYFDLYECAVEYDITDLLKRFSAWTMSSATVVKCQNIKFILDLPKTTSSKPYFRRRISENVEVIIHFEIDFARGMLLFKINLSGCGGIKPASVSGTFYILDIDGNERFRKQDLFYLERDKEYCCDFQIAGCDLSSVNLSLIDDIQIKCEFKIGYLDESCVSSEMEWSSNQEHSEDNSTSSVSESMEFVYKSCLHADTLLIVGLDETFHIFVHRSIMSARSPVFRDLLKNKCDFLRIFFPTEVAAQLVFYIYTGRLLDGQTDFESLHLAAKKYKILSLQSKCTELMKHHSKNRRASRNSYFATKCF